jgi:hypothetical protein
LVSPDHECGICGEVNVAEAAIRLKELRDGTPHQQLTLCIGCVGYVLRKKFKEQFISTQGN